MGTVSLDGTKIHANPSKHLALSWHHVCKLEPQLQGEVEALLRQAEAADQTDLPDGLDIPEELARREEPGRDCQSPKRRSNTGPQLAMRRSTRTTRRGSPSATPRSHKRARRCATPHPSRPNLAPGTRTKST